MNQKQKSQQYRLDPLTAAFTRVLTAEYHVRSTCRTCGTQIVGDVSMGHIEREREHLERCQTSRPFVVKRSS